MNAERKNALSDLLRRADALECRMSVLNDMLGALTANRTQRIVVTNYTTGKRLFECETKEIDDLRRAIELHISQLKSEYSLLDIGVE